MGCFYPHDIIDIEFYYGRFFPSYFSEYTYGIYLLRVKVNPNHTINESDYTNNNYYKILFIPFTGIPERWFNIYSST